MNVFVLFELGYWDYPDETLGVYTTELRAKNAAVRSSHKSKLKWDEAEAEGRDIYCVDGPFRIERWKINAK